MIELHVVIKKLFWSNSARNARSETISGSDASDLKLLAHKLTVDFLGRDAQRAEQKKSRITKYLQTYWHATLTVPHQVRVGSCINTRNSDGGLASCPLTNFHAAVMHGIISSFDEKTPCTSEKA
jgi:hypothetical protein